MITYAIKKSVETAKRKGWDKTYWAFDLHETIILPNWKEGEIPTEFYEHALDVLRTISNRKDIVMIMYTCSHPPEIAKYLKLFEENGVHFDYVNENPEVLTVKYGCYDKKPYFNVLFEDKAGFNPLEDWLKVKLLLEEIKYEQ